MSVIDQPALDLPGLAVPPPDVLAGLTVQDRAAVLDVLTRLIVKTIAPVLSVSGGEAGDE
jgi:hypothetical protein